MPHVRLAAHEAQDPVFFTSIVGVVLYALVIPIEMIRLYLGYRGNLSESVIALTSFLIASAVFEFPLLIFILLRNEVVPFEMASDVVLLIFVAGIHESGHSANLSKSSQKTIKTRPVANQLDAWSQRQRHQHQHQPAGRALTRTRFISLHLAAPGTSGCSSLWVKFIRSHYNETK
ncbi:uncharacterized protein MONBRDRAFT_5230 [Monosiga brevicollis MX1]|uniref:Uncharacterized protein n=1 Tax=Monosiga brevicollis TaxID=81824 RepID=A9UQC2_MONBE|nr:uncharacterized protein MONBRDRAFT_5230 [Monosiga brevicollis MX1]EDQ92571.1 predicted protein [Monosiga brevicollis MX1]|eukprot:XP_001742333.1 hypothetical protein [Monosiga brevicollis MX1]